ncbi:MAG: hypothetical protein V3T05_06645, partial [Myxococcota bacterium]
MSELRLHSLLLLACTSLFGCFGELGLTVSSCDGVTCGGHGRCLDLGDEVTCQCDAGFSRRDNLTCVDSAGDSAKPGDPTGGDPIAGDPIAGDPTAGDPIAGDPIAGDPTAGDPTAGDPIAGDPIAGDPIAGDPIAGDPIAGDPTAGDYNLANRISEPPTSPSDCSPL